MADAPIFDRLPLRLAAVFPAVPPRHGRRRSGATWRRRRRRLAGAGTSATASTSRRTRAARISASPPPAPLAHRRCAWRAPASGRRRGDHGRARRRGLVAAAEEAIDHGGESITLVVEPTPVLFLEIARQRALRRVCARARRAAGNPRRRARAVGRRSGRHRTRADPRDDRRRRRRSSAAPTPSPSPGTASIRCSPSTSSASSTKKRTSPR